LVSWDLHPHYLEIEDHGISAMLEFKLLAARLLRISSKGSKFKLLDPKCFDVKNLGPISWDLRPWSLCSRGSSMHKLLGRRLYGSWSSWISAPGVRAPGLKVLRLRLLRPQARGP